MPLDLTDPTDHVQVVAVSSLPPGMTQEEADRLVREADEANNKENR